MALSKTFDLLTGVKLFSKSIFSARSLVTYCFMALFLATKFSLFLNLPALLCLLLSKLLSSPAVSSLSLKCES